MRPSPTEPTQPEEDHGSLRAGTGQPVMRRFLAISAALLLIALGSQVVLAQYEPTGTLGLSGGNPPPGGQLTVSGDGFAPNSQVLITIESDPVLLATVTTDASGAFETQVTIPAGFSGAHRIVATGTDPAGSVRVLASAITVQASGVPSPSTNTQAASGTDVVVFILAGVGVLVLTGILLFVTRRRRPLS
jgi:hypothetical protein